MLSIIGYTFMVVVGFGSSQLNSVLHEIKTLLSRVKDPCQDDWDSIRVGLLLSKLEYEDLDVEKEYGKFLLLFEKVKSEINFDTNFADIKNQVSKIFFEKLGFDGDKTNYYNIKNSFLSDVYLRRKGIPVSLALVYLGFCRFLGLKAVGINFPGHFLIELIPSSGHFEKMSAMENVELWRKKQFVDCFEGSKYLTVDDCEQRLFQWTRGVIPFTEDLLKPAHPVAIVSRLLRNLKAIFIEKEDLARLYWVLTALIELSPDERVEAYRERGLLMGRIGRFIDAAEDLKVFLSESKDVMKSAHISSMLQIFENQTDIIN